MVSIEVIPVVFISKRELVYPEVRGYEPLVINDEQPEPVGFLSQLSKRFDAILVRDLDGITANRPQIELIQKICSKNRIWLDAGVKFADGIIDLLVAGADTIILTTAKLFGLRELEDAFEMSENIIFEVNYDERGVLSPDPELRRTDVKRLIDKVLKIGINDICLSYSSTPGAREKLWKGHELGFRQLRNILNGLNKNVNVYVTVRGSYRREIRALEERGIRALFVDLLEAIRLP